MLTRRILSPLVSHVMHWEHLSTKLFEIGALSTGHHLKAITSSWMVSNVVSLIQVSTNFCLILKIYSGCKERAAEVGRMIEKCNALHFRSIGKSPPVVPRYNLWQLLSRYSRVSRKHLKSPVSLRLLGSLRQQHLRVTSRAAVSSASPDAEQWRKTRLVVWHQTSYSSFLKLSASPKTGREWHDLVPRSKKSCSNTSNAKDLCNASMIDSSKGEGDYGIGTLGRNSEWRVISVTWLPASHKAYGGS